MSDGHHRNCNWPKDHQRSVKFSVVESMLEPGEDEDRDQRAGDA